MCNLGQGVFELGMERGMEQGMERGIEREKKQVIRNLMNLGVAMDVLMAAVNMSEKEVLALMEN